MDQNKALVVFQDTRIRRIWHKEEWWYSVVDVIGALAESEDPRTYWKVLKHRLLQEGADQTVTNCNQLKLPAEDGKLRETDCASTKTLLRLIQSVPSKKAEPFKQWLAEVGQERIQEIENPELAQKRMRELYKQKGYSEAWIEKRIRGIAIREELTDEWKDRSVGSEREFAILTAEISKATFGMTPSEYKQFKGLKRENLRDHMTSLELIFSMLGEAATTEITRAKDVHGFSDGKTAAQEGGTVAGNARKDLEQKSGQWVSTAENHFEQPEAVKQLEKKSNK